MILVLLILAAQAALPGASTSGVQTRTPDVVATSRVCPSSSPPQSPTHDAIVTRATIRARSVAHIVVPPSLRATASTVILEATVCADGTVPEVKVLLGLDPSLDASVLKAAKRLVFTPANVEGTAISTSVVLHFSVRQRRFEVHNEEPGHILWPPPPLPS